MSTTIDAILYINLEHRVDRNTHILNELHKICTDDSKIHRIDAVKNDNGALGCGLSHIKALEFALTNDWTNILIVEDDFTFNCNSNEIHKNIDLLFNYNFDVGLLSTNCLRYDDTNTKIKKVLYSQTASSYIIKKNYIHILLENFKDCVNDIILKHKNWIDIHWNKLQLIHNWYAIFPAIGYQYESYSDIEKKIVNYGC